MSLSDRVVVLLAIALVGVLYARLWVPGGEGRQAWLTVAGREQAPVDLGRDQEIVVQGALGASQLEVRAGRIRFTRSPCTGKQCIHSGWLERAGDFAACLPNAVSVQVVGLDARFDAISY